MNHYYILNDQGEPVPTEDLDAVASLLCVGHRRVVRQERIGKSEVSTVFLVINHQFSPDGPPVLWETMVFGGKLAGHQQRCSGSREQAEAMHNQVCAMVLRAQKNP